MDRPERSRGMMRFTAIWAGQLVSMIGTAMTQFAMTIWVWERTGQATPMVLMAFFAFIPMMVMSPFAGALVDRWDRKKTMLISDVAGCFGSLSIFILLSGNMLEVWHLYILGFMLGVFGSFAWPAYSSAITMMVDKRDYTRADGMMGIAEASSMIAGPILGLILLAIVYFRGILIFDILSFSFAIMMLLVIAIPNPPEKDTPEKGVSGILKDSVYGFRYIRARPPLLGLTLTFFMYNLISMFGLMVVSPMVLARTGDDRNILALLGATLGIGGLAGGIVMAVWGGPKRRINGLLGGMMISVFSAFLVLPSSPYFWAVAGFIMAFMGPVSNGCSQAIWQTKTPPHVQGRVFGARRFIAQVSSLIGMIIVGPLADKIFTPSLDVGGRWAHSLRWLIVPGPGSGMALMIFISFTLCTVASVIAYSVYSIRHVEDLIPDHDMTKIKGEKKDEKPDDREDKQESTNEPLEKEKKKV